MIRVEAQSRLHFGLLSLPGETAWEDTEGQVTLPARRFGGVGLMIDQPGIAMTVNEAADWSAHGPCAARALTVAKSVGASLGLSQPFTINIERCPAEHIGLGTGTQLSLAVARAIAVATHHENISIVDLAKLTGRGRRSAIGIHGFAHGGFLVEAGKCHDEDISPLVARLPFPEDWRVLLVMPRFLQGEHGQGEAEAFQRLSDFPPLLARTQSLCGMVLLGMLPAILEHDLDAFGAALYDFNRRVGAVFYGAAAYYASSQIAAIVSFLRENGILGTGQSSWGPTVFGVTDPERAEWVAEALVTGMNLDKNELLIAGAAKGGAASGTSSTCRNQTAS